jgi:hypothetical protein
MGRHCPTREGKHSKQVAHWVKCLGEPNRGESGHYLVGDG